MKTITIAYEYTPIRRFYAWVGFLTLAYLAFKCIAWLILAIQVIAAHGY